MEGKAVFFSLCLRLLVYLSHHHWRSVFCSWFLSGFLGQKATGWATGKATGVIFFVQTTLGLFGVPSLFGDQFVEGGKMIQRVILAWYLFDILYILVFFWCENATCTQKSSTCPCPRISICIYSSSVFAGYVHMHSRNQGSSSLTCFNIALTQTTK